MEALSSRACLFGFINGILVSLHVVLPLSIIFVFLAWESPRYYTVHQKIIEIHICVNLFTQDKACDAMEIFDELVESEVSIVTPHLKTLVEFCLQVCHMFESTCLLLLISKLSSRSSCDRVVTVVQAFLASRRIILYCQLLTALHEPCYQLEVASVVVSTTSMHI